MYMHFQCGQWVGKMFDAAKDLVGLPATFAGTEASDALLQLALDELDPGIIVLGEDYAVEFINRAFHTMWALPWLRNRATYSFEGLIDHGRRTGLYLTESASLQSYVRQRKGRLRLTDGRVLKFECKSLPGGRHLMTFTDISDFVHTTDKLRDLAAIDDLTNIPNRRQFLKELDIEFRRTIREGRSFSVLMFDADNFKSINDRFGHSAGDEVLRALASRARAIIRETDLLGRLGGEEFAAVLKDVALPAALETADRLRQEVAATPFTVAGGEISVTVSMGVATRRPQDDNGTQLLRLADEALLTAKVGGRNRVIAASGG
jgi:diguanylate cyclase (GGDEF)-like protein